MVLSIANVSSKALVLPTLRRMLTALNLYPLFLKWMPRNVSASTLDFWADRFLDRNLYRYSQLPLAILLRGASIVLQSLKPILSLTKITLTTTRSVKDILLQIVTSVSDYILRTIPSETISALPKV